MFAPEQTIMQKTSVYAKDNNGSIRVWSIEGHVGIERGHKTGKLKISHGVLGGEIQETWEDVPIGLASRSLNEQVFSRCHSRLHNKLKSGYVYDLEQAKNNQRVNLLGLHKPMLAKKYKNRKDKIDWDDRVFIQPKFNGHRCLSGMKDEKTIMYSRNGIIIPAIEEIRVQADWINKNFGHPLDGELYYHGAPLQAISSWAKKRQLNTTKLVYMVYDSVMDCAYWDRLVLLNEISLSVKEEFKESCKIFLSSTKIVLSPEEAMEQFKQHRRQGYEGSILRTNDCNYEVGKRSNSLLKMKEFHDDEFLITDIRCSSEGWAILVCTTKQGKTFSVSAPGTKEEKKIIFDNRNTHIGQYVNVEYAEYTAGNVPFHPIATAIRNAPTE